MYLDQLKALAEPLGLPVITGSTSQRMRDKPFADFREGRIRVLAVSKVANFAVDLPEASLAIQVSGTFGSARKRRSASAASCVPRRKRTRRTSTAS